MLKQACIVVKGGLKTRQHTVGQHKKDKAQENVRKRFHKEVGFQSVLCLGRVLHKLGADRTHNIDTYYAVDPTSEK